MRVLAILLSGRGSNFVSIYNAIGRGEIDAEIGVVISNVEEAKGLEIARGHGIASVSIPHGGMPREEHERLVAQAIDDHAANFVVLAGYMRLLSPWFIGRYRERIVNIHPSLLPAFPGADAQRQAFEHGVKISGCTVHFVDEELDHGPIVAQRAVDISDAKTPEEAAGLILEAEHELYPRALGLLCSREWSIDGRRVTIQPRVTSLDLE
ncbi:MAG: phosphoribosylglycinamide formyltransferase [Acidobacteria bacterium]|nr:phosphoribosylglycinamide formyltransferase [Acidobacteriota bacterium]